MMHCGMSPFFSLFLSSLVLKEVCKFNLIIKFVIILLKFYNQAFSLTKGIIDVNVLLKFVVHI